MRLLLHNERSGDEQSYDWPGPQMIEFSFGVMYIGNKDTGIPALMYNHSMYSWDELDISGRTTGRDFTSIRIISDE